MEWHHFDPPWRQVNHYDASGMIALCTHHHPEADGGAYTKDQLRQFKAAATRKVGVVDGKFNWLRSRLLVHVGGNHYLDTNEILRLHGRRIIWFSRDDEDHWLLNITGVSRSDEQRFAIEENYWVVHGNQEDLECPPSGRALRVRYPNGDEYSVEFHELLDADALVKRYPYGHPRLREIQTPITSVDITFRVAGTALDFGPRHTLLGGVHISGSLVQGCQCVFVVE